MKGFRLIIVFLALACIALPPQVHADLDVKLLMAGTSSSLSDGGAVAQADGYGIGYGLLMTGRITRDWNYEFGGVFLNRKTQSAVLPERSSLMLPLVFAYRLIEGLRANVGGYWDYSLQTPPLGYQASAYGALGGLSLDLQLIPGVGLVLGGQYLLQLSSLQPGSLSTKFSDLLLTAGFRLGETR